MLAELITSTTSTMPPPPKVSSRQRRCVAAAAAAVVAVLVFIGALPTVAAQAHPSTGSTLVMNLTSDSAQDARCSCDGCRRGFGRADGSLDRDVDLSAYHWVQLGVARSGSTVQFQILCISLALQLADKQPALLPNLTCSFQGASPGTLEGPYVSKTHGGTFNLSPRQWRALGLDPGGPPTTYLDTVDRDPANGVVVFITERRKRAALVSPDVRANGHKVPLVVDLDDLVALGVPGVIELYRDMLGLSPTQMDVLREYMRHWDVLRMCCGVQMSSDWRGALSLDTRDDTHACSIYDISAVERRFMRTTAYKMFAPHPNLAKILQPSLRDRPLAGTYCETYNRAVTSQHLHFNQHPHDPT